MRFARTRVPVITRSVGLADLPQGESRAKKKKSLYGWSAGIYPGLESVFLVLSNQRNQVHAR